MLAQPVLLGLAVATAALLMLTTPSAPLPITPIIVLPVEEHATPPAVDAVARVKLVLFNTKLRKPRPYATARVLPQAILHAMASSVGPQTPPLLPAVATEIALGDPVMRAALPRTLTTLASSDVHRRGSFVLEAVGPPNAPFTPTPCRPLLG